MESKDQQPILVVDDDEIILSTVEFILVEDGYAVVVASNGKEALDSAEKHSPSVILLDMKMPVMDGWAFVKAYRERPGPHAAIIMMTAAHDSRSRASEIAADAYVEKPFDVDHVLSLVRRFASRQTAQE